MTRNWDSARMYCNSLNAELVKIEDQLEQNFLSSFNKQFNFNGVRDYWIGASNIGHRESFQWIDGSSLNNFNDFPDNMVPKPDSQADQCIGALTTGTTNNWDVEKCGQPRAFVCSVPIGSHILQPEEEDYLCGTGFHYFHDESNDSHNCYIVSNQTKTGDRCTAYCEQRGTAFVSIMSDDENSFIGHLATDHIIPTWTDLWIGLKTTEGTGNEGLINAHWEDGKEVTYEHFTEGWPNYIDYKDDGDCVHMVGDGPERKSVRNRIRLTISLSALM